MLAALITGGTWLSAPAAAQDTMRIVATVNDEPISEFDVVQRMKLNQAMGDSHGSAAERRKASLQELVDDALKRQEAARLGAAASEEELQSTIEKMAERMGTTVDGLTQRLRQNGVDMKTVKAKMAASLAWGRIVRARYQQQIQLDPAHVDRRFEELSKERAKMAERLYVLQQIVLPTEQNASRELVMARAVEARQIMAAFDGCSSLPKITRNVFNVKVGKQVPVPASSVPGKLKELLDKAGPGNVIGPSRSPAGIELVAYCARRQNEPPPLEREQVESMLINERYEMIGQRFLNDLRRDAIVEYRDASG